MNTPNHTLSHPGPAGSTKKSVPPDSPHQRAAQQDISAADEAAPVTPLPYYPSDGAKPEVRAEAARLFQVGRTPPFHLAPLVPAGRHTRCPVFGTSPAIPGAPVRGEGG